MPFVGSVSFHYQPRYRDSLHESRRQPEGQVGEGASGGTNSSGGSAGGPQPLQEQPALVAAAFFLATKKVKVGGMDGVCFCPPFAPLTYAVQTQIKVDRKRLQEVVGVQAGELNNVINSMQVRSIARPCLPPCYDG